MGVAAAVAWALASGPVVGWLLDRAVPAWIVMLAYHAACWLAASLVSGRLGRRPRAGALLAAGFLSAVVTVAAFAAAGALLPVLRRPVPVWETWGVRPPADTAILLYYAGVNPWIEERFWRGALLGARVRSRLGVAVVWSLAAVAFVPLHFAVLRASFGAGNGAGLAVPILGASLAWTAMRWRTGSAWWGAASHAGADLGLCLGYFLWLRS